MWAKGEGRGRRGGRKGGAKMGNEEEVVGEDRQWVSVEKGSGGGRLDEGGGLLRGKGKSWGVTTEGGRCGGGGDVWVVIGEETFMGSCQESI